MAGFAALLCFLRLCQRHNRIDGHLHAPGVDQFADFGQLYTTGLQKLMMACPNGNTSFSGAFSGKIAEAYRYKSAATLEHSKQVIILTAYGVKDHIDIADNLFYGCDRVINEFINAQ